MRKKIKNAIKIFDFFGINFTLKYKEYEIFKSFFGGLFFIFFLIGIVIYLFISIISFFKKEKMTINYYDSQITETDIISFKNYSYGFGFYGYCNDENGEIINDTFNELFNYQFHYVSIEKKNNIKQIKKKHQINFHLCKYSDFYNYSMTTLDLIGVNGVYLCPDYLNETIQGVFTDNNFDYFEITLSAKYPNIENYTKYYNLLIGNDCKLHFFFPVIAINMNNHSHPFEHNLFDIALQINPYFYAKRDIFFRVVKFTNFENYFFDFSHTKYYLDYASFNDYFLFRTNNRFLEKFTDYEKFARIYLRADTKRTNISREYEKFSYLIANVSSLFSVLFIFLRFFVSYVNRFYAYNSIIRKIFKFNNIQGTNTYDLLHNLNQTIKITKMLKINNLNIKSFYKFDQSKFYQEKIPYFTNNTDKNISKSVLYIKPKSLIKENNTNEKNESTILFIKNENNENKKSSTHIYNKSIDILNSNQNLGFKFNPSNINIYKKKLELNLKYYSYETFVYLFCPKLAKGKLNKKNQIMKKSVEKLLYNLDIHVYFNKMHMIELFNYIFFESYQNNILRFLSKPYISISHNKSSLIDCLPKIYKPDLNYQENNDFIISYNKIIELKNKNKIEEKLYNMVNLEISNLFE